MNMLSPGVQNREQSTQSTVVKNSTGRAALVGKFLWGPAFQIKQISNEVELATYFGTPDNITADYFISAANFLQYGSDLRTVRVLDAEKARNATAIVNQIKTNIVNEGASYVVGDKIIVKYTGKAVESDGKITKVDKDGKIKAVFIPSSKIIDKAIQIKDTSLTTGWTVELQSLTGASGSVVLSGIESDSGIFLPNTDSASTKIKDSTFVASCAKYQLPVLAAIYAGEIGSTLEVEIVSYDTYNKREKITRFPDGQLVDNTVASVFTYGPQDKDEYAIIVRRGGIIQEYFILSSKKNAKNVYGNNIYIDDFFANGGSRYIYMTTANWIDGFSGVLVLRGGNSGNDTTTAAQFINGWDLFSDRETVHVPLLIAGAVAGETDEIASTVQKYVVSIAESRQDTLACISPPKNKVVNIPTLTAVDNMIEWRTGRKISNPETVVDNNMNTSSSYFVIDGNYKYQYDKYNDVNRWVPLAADIAGLCVNTDNVAQTWMSPAGMTRGNIKNCIKLAIEPKEPQRNSLYQVQINPVISTETGSAVLWGDKTGVTKPSPFDRINVRRLFNMIKKDIGSNAKYKLFENNDDFTRSSFRMDTGDYMKNIRSLGGCYDYRVVCDTTNNTPDVIDRQEFVASIYVKPPRSINYIILNYVATGTGANFDELIGPAD
ncbi:tail sheath protein [Morganella phage vB_Mm5]